jgi:hypothetical protein
MRSILIAATLALMPLAAHAEFLNPDLNQLTIESVAAPDWIAGVRDGAYVGMCTTCDGTMMLQVQVLDDDGTGGRVRSGETTPERYTEIGTANAAKLGGDAAYFGTERIDFASAVGFRTSARIATGDYSVTYQLWDDGKQLVIKVYGPDQTQVDALAQKAYTAAAPLSFR